jgi:hypothetical protein
LGLTLAQHIAQEHGGEVTLDESSPGTTIFTVLLNKATLSEFELAVAGTIHADGVMGHISSNGNAKQSIGAERP